MRLTSSLFTVVTLIVTVSITAQTEITVVAPSPQVDAVRLHVMASGGIVGTLDTGEVLNRLWSFDLNADDRISSDELPERMQALLKADQNGDGFLISEELLKAVRDASLTHANTPRLGAKVVTLVDVISDLRLPQPKHGLAMNLVKQYSVPRNVNINITESEVLNGLRELLDDEEYDNFRAAAARIRNGHAISRFGRQ